MSVTVNAHGPHKPIARLIGEGAAAFGSLDTDGLSLFIHTREECDALVKAALAIRDLLPEPAPPEPCGDIPAHRSYEQARTDMATMTDAEWEASDKLPPYTEPPGITHCAPGTCTCGGSVDAAGVFHAAVTRA